MLLDSTFLHDLVREDDDAVATLAELIANGTPVALSTLTVFEVEIGLRGDAVIRTVGVNYRSLSTPSPVMTGNSLQ